MFAIPSCREDLSFSDGNESPLVLVTTPFEDSVNVKISVIGTGYTINAAVTKYRHASVTLPQSVRLTGTGKSNTTIRVISSGITSVYCMNTELISGDGFLVLPTTQLGKQYYAVTYKPFFGRFHAFICVSALDQETSINITTKAGQTYQIKLTAYESYRLKGKDREDWKGVSYEDLTGTFIEASAPISVISGVYTKVGVSNENWGGELVGQMIPSKSWQCSYILSPFLGRSSGYIYRILSSNHTVTVNISNYGRVQIEANAWYEGNVMSDIVTSIKADSPVSVVQYMKSCNTGPNKDGKGNPAMLVVTPVEHFANNVSFPVVAPFIHTEMQYSIHVIINCLYANGLMFDDTESMSDWQRLKTVDDEMCAIRGTVTTGLHSVTHHNPEAKFSVAVYGYSFGIWKRGYAYPVGYAADMGKRRFQND